MPRGERRTLRRVAFATYRDRPAITPDDRHLARALRTRGVRVEAAPWDAPGVPWASFDLVLVRSTWNYYHHAPEFLRWVRSVGRRTLLWNSPETIRWNAHKRYLLDLEAKGVPIVPTRLLRRSRSSNLAALLRATGWREFVLKPAIGADHFGFLASDVDHLPAAQRHLRRLLGEGDVLVQPFRSAATRHGERSFVYLGGRFSHCAEYPYLGRYGVRRTRLARPRAAERRIADAAVAAAGGDLLYARADFLPTDSGGWELGELEQIEPELLFRTAPASAVRFATAILRRWSSATLRPGIRRHEAWPQRATSSGRYASSGDVGPARSGVTGDRRGTRR